MNFSWQLGCATPCPLMFSTNSKVFIISPPPANLKELLPQIWCHSFLHLHCKPWGWYMGGWMGQEGNQTTWCWEPNRLKDAPVLLLMVQNQAIATWDVKKTLYADQSLPIPMSIPNVLEDTKSNLILSSWQKNVIEKKRMRIQNVV